MTDIVYFSGPYRFLSNFYETPITWCGRTYPTSEHLYQARKTRNPEWRLRIGTAATAAEAKKLGQQAPLSPSWDADKIDVMDEILSLKFQGQLAGKLADTGTALLIEGNSWHDQFWGDCYCPQHKEQRGQNALGILLMNLRLRLR